MINYKAVTHFYWWSTFLSYTFSGWYSTSTKLASQPPASRTVWTKLACTMSKTTSHAQAAWHSCSAPCQITNPFFKISSFLSSMLYTLSQASSHNAATTSWKRTWQVMGEDRTRQKHPPEPTEVVAWGKSLESGSLMVSRAVLHETAVRSSSPAPGCECPHGPT